MPARLSSIAAVADRKKAAGRDACLYHRSIIVMGGFSMRKSFLVLAALLAAQASVSAKSMTEEFGGLIGNWSCRVTEAGKPDSAISLHYEWAYGGSVLKETMTGSMTGEFLTTFDKHSDSFKGVGVGSWGGYVVWENPGTVAGKSSEIGYLFGGGKMTAVSRTDWELISPTHYVIRDYEADRPDGSKGAPSDTEDCTKQA